MPKTPLRVLKNGKRKDQVLCEVRIANDRRCFSARLETGQPYSYKEYLHLLIEFAQAELVELTPGVDDKTH
jgi:hypothetical protein